MINFNHTSLSNQKFSSSEVSVFHFEGRNHGLPTKVKSTQVSCGCTQVTHPEIIEDGFTITLRVDKRNQSGHTYQSATIHFENGDSVTLYVNGIIN